MRNTKFRQINILNEDKRTDLINKSKRGDNYKPENQIYGKNRFERRLRSKFANSVKEYNSINMDKLFKDGILDVDIKIKGETDTYLVKISYGSFLDSLTRQLRNDEELNVRHVIRALVSGFNSDDVYIHCTCPDWKYRFAYWATTNKINSIPDEQHSNGKRIANPNDTKGAACKHVLLVLNNNTWINKVSRVIINYINYMEEHQQQLYAEIIFPAIYNRPYEEPVQTSMGTLDTNDSGEPVFNKSDLAKNNNTDELDRANNYARTKNQFKKGNQSGVQFAPNPNNSKQFDMSSLLDDNN